MSQRHWSSTAYEPDVVAGTGTFGRWPWIRALHTVLYITTRLAHLPRTHPSRDLPMLDSVLLSRVIAGLLVCVWIASNVRKRTRLSHIPVAVRSVFLSRDTHADPAGLVAEGIVDMGSREGRVLQSCGHDVSEMVRPGRPRLSHQGGTDCGLAGFYSRSFRS
jgi:hypothetical protein